MSSCPVVTIQVTLSTEGENSFLLKSTVYSSEHADCVQLTDTNAGTAQCLPKTTLLLGGQDNDWKPDHKVPFSQT